MTIQYKVNSYYELWTIVNNNVCIQYWFINSKKYARLKQDFINRNLEEGEEIYENSFYFIFNFLNKL